MIVRSNLGDLRTDAGGYDIGPRKIVGIAADNDGWSYLAAGQVAVVVRHCDDITAMVSHCRPHLLPSRPASRPNLRASRRRRASSREAAMFHLAHRAGPRPAPRSPLHWYGEPGRGHAAFGPSLPRVS